MPALFSKNCLECSYSTNVHARMSIMHCVIHFVYKCMCMQESLCDCVQYARKSVYDCGYSHSFAYNNYRLSIFKLCLHCQRVAPNVKQMCMQESLCVIVATALHSNVEHQMIQLEKA